MNGVASSRSSFPDENRGLPDLAVKLRLAGESDTRYLGAAPVVSCALLMHLRILFFFSTAILPCDLIMLLEFSMTIYRSISWAAFHEQMRTVFQALVVY